MNAKKTFAAGIVALAVTTATVVPLLDHVRGVRMPPPEGAAENATFDVHQSAALFVGVRHFSHEELLDVPFAVDDAVDLAFMFALDPRVRLVPPSRVVLALAGRPQKAESRKRLEALQRAGARVEQAGQSDILTLLEEQAALADRNGILIVSLATHGFVHEGQGYLLGSSSLFRHHETAVPAAKVFDITATSEARRSLVFIDACRERISAGQRAGMAEPLTAAPMIRRMTRIDGQVIFFAAPAGGYAYDDPIAGNGVFTKAVLDGLSCMATASRGIVTVETLRTYVERSVRQWIRLHRRQIVRAAIQVSMEGDSKNMPLSLCTTLLPPQPPTGPTPSKVLHRGLTVIASTLTGVTLWQRDIRSPIVHSEVLDFERDGRTEILATTRNSIVVFDSGGRLLWTAAEGMTLRKSFTGDLFRNGTRQVVALWTDERSAASRVILYGSGGDRLGILDYDGRLLNVMADRPTARHAPKLVVSWEQGVFLLNPRKVAAGPVWSGILNPPSERVRELRVIDHDNDARRDIGFTTSTGNSLFVDFEGRLISSRTGGAQFLLQRHDPRVVGRAVGPRIDTILQPSRSKSSSTNSNSSVRVDTTRPDR